MGGVALGAALWASAPAEAEAQYAPPPPRYAPYGQPAYPPPVQYYPKPAGPPLVFYGWDADVPPPAGYDLRSSPNSKLIGLGVGMFSVGYVTAGVVGLVAVSDQRPADADDWYPLFVPIAGPFVAMGTLEASTGETGVLLADGILQVAGLLAIIGGALDTRYKLVRTQVGLSDDVVVDVMPTIGASGSGLTAKVGF